ncbi:hypothetical protein [Nocardia sp. NPDC058666]|uniref:hypothetical protein n=1 Tax=Nocardia sp. NPDC058666 TaxID=3346587 RepID=UPI00364FABEB
MKTASVVAAATVAVGSLIGLAAPASAATPGSQCTADVDAVTAVGVVSSNGKSCTFTAEALEPLLGEVANVGGHAISNLVHGIFVSSNNVLACGTSIAGFVRVSCPN